MILLLNLGSTAEKADKQFCSQHVTKYNNLYYFMDSQICALGQTYSLVVLLQTYKPKCLVNNLQHVHICYLC